MDTMEVKIDAKEYYVKDMFGDKFFFSIPYFQRAFRWKGENFLQLYEDLEDALQFNKEKHVEDIKNYEPYFMGSVILRQNFEADVYDIIDGQQRLVSLSILIAVLRDLIRRDYKNNNIDLDIYIEKKNVLTDLDEKLHSKSKPISGIPEKIRIEVWEKEREFYKNHIIRMGGTLERYPDLIKNEAVQHMVDAMNIFKKSFEDKDTEFLENYATYLSQKVALVVIRTKDLEKAFKLFNVINTRGTPLTNADLLKGENLNVIQRSEMEEYKRRWEDIENDFGIEKLEMFIGFIRSIKLKEKPKQSIYKEFTDKIFPKDHDFKGKKFIEYLYEISEIYRTKIKDAEIKNVKKSEEKIYYHNLMSIMRDFIPYSDWMIGVIKFIEKFGKEDEENLFKFLRLYERKIAMDLLSNQSLTKRLVEIYKIVELIERAGLPEDVFNKPVLTNDIEYRKDEYRKFLDDVYFYKHTGIAKYVLLRIEIESSDNTDKKIVFTEKITIEHILPQTPDSEYWFSRFNEDNMLKWTHRIGNLVLLNKSFNSKVKRKPYPEKVKKYSQKNSDLNLVNELITKYKDWNLDNLKERHNNLINRAEKIWFNNI